MTRSLLVLLLLLPELSSVSADLEIRAQRGLVSVRAQAVPLTEVLGQLCEKTGAELVYEGPRPSPLVTVNIENAPEGELPGRILEGLGINYAYQMDASGKRVERLIVGETFGSGPSGTTSRPSTLARFGPPLPSAEGESAPADDSRYGSPDESSPVDNAVPLTPGASPESFGEYGSPDEPSLEGGSGPSSTSGASSGGLAHPPEFPADASSPFPPSPPIPYPVFPGDPSNPRPGMGASPF
jgi:hypothetical protein